MSASSVDVWIALASFANWRISICFIPSKRIQFFFLLLYMTDSFIVKLSIPTCAGDVAARALILRDAHYCFIRSPKVLSTVQSLA